MGLKSAVLAQQQDDPSCHGQGDDRPNYDEDPNVDLFVGDPKEGRPIVEKSNTPIKNDVDPFNATVCHGYRAAFHLGAVLRGNTA